jgi:hypothetical protein
VKIAARAFRGEFEALLRAEEFVGFRDQLRPLPESLEDHARAIAVQQRLRAEYPDEHYSRCHVWAIWRLKT